MFGYFEAIKKLNEEQLEAMAAASASFTERLESVTGRAKDYSNRSFAHARTFVAQVDEGFKLYADFVKASCQELATQASRNGDLYVSLAKQSLTSVEAAMVKMPGAVSTKAQTS